MVMMVLVLNIVHAELKDTCNFVIKMNLSQGMESLMTTKTLSTNTTCKLFTLQTLPTTSIFYVLT